MRVICIFSYRMPILFCGRVATFNFNNITKKKHGYRWYCRNVFVKYNQSLYFPQDFRFLQKIVGATRFWKTTSGCRRHLHNNQINVETAMSKFVTTVVGDDGGGF
jgi:HSP90 family molecular chaperone